MANKARRRRRGRLLKGKFQETVTLGTLAASTGILGVISDNVDEQAFYLSVEATYALQGHTAGEGPIEVYACHSDYTLAEVEEFIENTQAWSKGDLISQEINKRKIRYVGSFSGNEVAEVLNDGNLLKTSLKFSGISGTSISFCCYNHDSGGLTTGTLVVIAGHVWIRTSG